MSFSLPKNVPKFDNDQRSFENVYWGASNRSAHNGHATSIGSSLNGFFDNKSLPMYKDKPYSYASSMRHVPFLKRRRVWLGGFLSLCVFLLYWTYLWPSGHTSGETRAASKSTWNWLSKSGSAPDWDFRREAVKEAFKLSWDSYATHAWGRLSITTAQFTVFPAVRRHTRIWSMFTDFSISQAWMSITQYRRLASK